MSVTPSVPTTVSIELRDDCTLACVTGKMFDEQACRDFDRVLLPAALRHGRPVVLDMSGIKYVPSLAIGALLKLMKALRDGGQRLILAAVQPPVRQVFTICRVDAVLELQDTVDQAIARCRSGDAAMSPPPQPDQPRAAGA
jgi:anti-anti-sigma factor